MVNLIVLLFLLSLVFFVISLVNHKIINDIIRRDLSRKNVLLILGGITLFLFISIGFFPSENLNKTSEPDAQNIVEENNNFEEQNIEESNNNDSSVIEENNQDVSSYRVVKVIDGDTIDININNEIVRIRLIGLDSPEMSHLECYAQEATNKAKEILLNKDVMLEADPSQGEIDKYNRLLRYVFFQDGTDYNKWMIQNGFAYEYTYNKPYKYQADYKIAQQYAKSNKLGLWKPGVCDIGIHVGETINAVDSNTDSSSQIDNEVANTKIETSPSCLIKGNISSNGYLYHTPNCPSYNRTVIDESKGERWFCTETEALAAGWIRAGNCP